MPTNNDKPTTWAQVMSAETTTITLWRREFNTVLAALRYWQREGLMSGGHEQDIASDGDTEPLSAEEIDVLCERINVWSAHADKL